MTRNSKYLGASTKPKTTSRLAPNRRRGEIAADFDGEPRLLCLTLGALAELEAALGVDNIADLGARFAHGKLSARDIIAILGAGLRGAGNRIDDEDVAMMGSEGGAAGLARIAAELLVATFAHGETVADPSGPAGPSGPSKQTGLASPGGGAIRPGGNSTREAGANAASVPFETRHR